MLGSTTGALAAGLLATAVSASPLIDSRGEASVSNAKTSLTLLYQNNLNSSDDANHIGAILLDPMTASNAAAACSNIGESLLSQAALEDHSSDFFHQLAYLEYSGRYHPFQQFLIEDAVVSPTVFGTLKYHKKARGHRRLPVLCTQSSTSSALTSAAANASTELTIASTGNNYVGFRNQKSFRFLGIPYATPPARFEYSTLYNQTGQTIQATSYSQDCAQNFDDNSGENCLFLNIQTPFIPKAGSKKGLKPVLFSIHGGGFTGGSGASGGMDGGNFASREDIVSVEINYRLSTLGFLAIPGTDIAGNYGIGDQLTALRWAKENIANFGGDPDQITIIGGSAGAASVRALLASPPAIEENLFAGAVAQSNLGGGVDLGLDGNYGTEYSSYLTIEESYDRAGQQIFSEAGCNQTSLDAQIACLKTVPADTLVGLSTVARYIVQDGDIITTEQLIVSTKNGSTAHVPVIFGTTDNDGASFSNFPDVNVTSESQGLQIGLGISEYYAQSIIDSGLFPIYNTGNLTLDSFNVTQRVKTDNTFRCIDEATVYAGVETGAFPKAYYYTFDRTYGGYDPDNLGASGLSTGPVTPGYPYGNPNLPYFRLHGADVGFTYGNQSPLRDANDLYANQLISGYFAAFTRTRDPNPPLSYLIVRGYVTETAGVEESGPWLPVHGENGPSKVLNFPAPTVEFPDMPQCAFLNYSISYYLDGGS
ncbi:hypothetical protein NU195Hw_g2851t1 [Hortaea werneckii]